MQEKELGEIVLIVRARLLFYREKLRVFNYNIRLTCLLALGITARTYPQGEKIDLNIHNLKLRQVLPILKYKDKINLLYNTSTNRNVSLKVSVVAVLEVLDKLLKWENKPHDQTLKSGVAGIIDRHQIRAQANTTIAKEKERK